MNLLLYDFSNVEIANVSIFTVRSQRILSRSRKCENSSVGVVKRL